jgi:hypothetical protein
MSCVRKEKNRQAIFKKQKNALRILNLLSGVLGRCILSFFARAEFHSSDFPPLWSEQYQMSLCETSLNAERKIVYFFRSRLVHYDQPVFNPFFPNEFSVKT